MAKYEKPKTHIKPKPQDANNSDDDGISLIPTFTVFEVAEFILLGATFLSIASSSIRLPSWNRFFFYTSLYMFFERSTFAAALHPPILKNLPPSTPAMVNMYHYDSLE